MRKLIWILAVLLVLTGCQHRPVDYDAAVHSALSVPLPQSTNYSKHYYRYYLLPDAGVKASTQISTLFEVDGNPVMLDLDVANVVSKRYNELQQSQDSAKSFEFKSIINPERVSYATTGTYFDLNDQEQHYILSIIETNGSQAIILENGMVDLIAVAKGPSIERVIMSMFTTLRSVRIEEDRVVRDFSKKDIITYQERYEDFLKHAVPESGAISDIIDKTEPEK